MKKSLMAMVFAGSALGVLSAGCTQMPTEKQGIADMRPQISFSVGDSETQGARVTLDGLDVGTVGDYVDGVSSLRILSGTHILRVVSGSRTVLEERFYLGDGTHRTFILK